MPGKMVVVGTVRGRGKPSGAVDDPKMIMDGLSCPRSRGDTLRANDAPVRGSYTIQITGTLAQRLARLA